MIHSDQRVLSFVPFFTLSSFKADHSCPECFSFDRDLYTGLLW